MQLEAVHITRATELARLAAEVASERKAEDVIVLDISKLTFLADVFVICTAPTERQLRAISQVITESLEKDGGRLRRSEGKPASGWVLLDFGDVIVHLFSPAQREYYRLERFWSAATTVVRFQ